MLPSGRFGGAGMNPFYYWYGYFLHGYTLKENKYVVNFPQCRMKHIKEFISWASSEYKCEYEFRPVLNSIYQENEHYSMRCYALLHLLIDRRASGIMLPRNMKHYMRGLLDRKSTISPQTDKRMAEFKMPYNTDVIIFLNLQGVNHRVDDENRIRIYGEEWIRTLYRNLYNRIWYPHIAKKFTKMRQAAGGTSAGL